MRSSKRRLWSSLPLALFLLSPPVEAEPRSLADLSVEQLINLRVTSVSKREQKLSEAAAAVFVITKEDIRRSGVTSLPEALRLAPGIQVARTNTNVWAVTARGFNSVFANKLLVLLDGRSVYNPFFSGVNWDVLNVMLEDVERIEVIRGPGATLWGTNAVNGVINIITDDSEKSVGQMVSAGGGSEDRFIAGARTGGRLGEGRSYRIYAHAFERDGIERDGSERYEDQGGADEDWRGGHVGFRGDLRGKDQLFTFLGEIYQGSGSDRFTLPLLTPPYASVRGSDREHEGGYLLSRWRSTPSINSELQVQAYIDLQRRSEYLLTQRRDVFDLELQHRLSMSPNNTLTYGVGANVYRDEIGQDEETYVLTIDPPRRVVNLYNLFLQNEHHFDRLRVIAGAKVEYTEFTGFEVQPNLRALFAVTPKDTLWGAVSRAVRTPSRAENDAAIGVSTHPLPNGLTRIDAVGSTDFNSENLLSYEVGYRRSFSPHTSLDLSLYYNDYTDLRTLEPGAPSVSERGYLVSPIVASNLSEGTTYGGEVSLDHKVSERWRVSGHYSYLDFSIRPQEESRDPFSTYLTGASPEHQLFLRSSLDLSEYVQVDALVRYVSSLHTLSVGGYWEGGLRLGYRVREGLELSLTGHDLFHERHKEFVGNDVISLRPTSIERGVFAKVVWRF